MSAITVNNLCKSYKSYSSEIGRFLSWGGISFGTVTENKILKDISFSVEAGEVVGVVGQNGAGKSTLLKLLTGTVKQTSGSYCINGRIAAILELGMGFNADFNGRQNTFNSMAMMGFTRKQISAVIDNVEEFAEIGEYFDQPVRMYSSGMQMRLAFAIATAYRPEILIVDEALSVGDAYFQHKSFSRIKEFQKLGTTLLLVSHDRGAIQSICDRAILLEKGCIIKDGRPEEIMDYYNAIIAEKGKSTVKQITLDNGKVQTISGTGQACVESIGLYDDKDTKIEVAGVGQKVELRINVKVNEDLDSLVLGYGIKDRLGQVIYGTNTWHTSQRIQNAKKGDSYEFRISFDANLGLGSYSVQTALVDTDNHLSSNYEWRDLALIFEIINLNKNVFVGCAYIEPEIQITRID